MNFSALLYYAEKKNIIIDYFPICGLKAMCVKIDKKYHIDLNEKLIESDQEKKIALAHEIGHCVTNKLYYIEDITNPLYRQNVEKAEAVAIKKSLTYLVPAEELKQALTKTKDIYELAELFDTTEEIIKKAIDLYISKKLI